MNTQLIEYIVKQLVDHPDSVSVSEQHQGDKTVFTVYVATTDLKRVIGKDGRVIRAIRALFGASFSGNFDLIVESISSTVA